MCGVSGLFRFDGEIGPRDLKAVRAMDSSMAFRGPDGSGEYRDRQILLGHRRLSIIDPSDAGRQPMSNEDGTVWLCFNGEIYNFACLRAELECKHRFASKTDAEVLIHGYEQWGLRGVLSRTRGMFAFALVDTRRTAAPELMLVRDRFGIKPLYFYQDSEKVLFASQVQALCRSGLIPERRNPRALAQFLQFGSLPEPTTTIRGVTPLPPAHYARIGPEGVRLQRYWKLAPQGQSPTQGLDKDRIQATRDLLDETVKLHLYSDVPLGVFLSGGTDSSSLVALAARHRTTPLKTLSVTFGEEEFSEARYARMVARRFATDHQEMLLTERVFYEQLPRFFEVVDQPSIDGLNTYFVSRCARECGLKVVLSGLGGDEVFLGYPHFRTAYRLERLWLLYCKLPQSARRALISAAVAAGRLMRKSKLEKVRYLEPPSSCAFYLLYRGLFSPAQIAKLVGGRISPSRTLCSLNGIPVSTLHEALVHHEFEGYLKNQLLKDTDTMSMAHSIEARVPLLDHELVDHVLSLPARVKFSSNVNKPLLVSSMADDLPEAVWARPKMGFTFPFAHWIKKRQADFRATVRRADLFDQTEVDRIWGQFLAGRAHWSQPWALVVAAQTGLAH